MKLNETIKNRKSCRLFSDEELSNEQIALLLESARWAPSGKNGQPWRFVIVQNYDVKRDIALCSIYGNWMKEASVFIVVYMDREKSYSYKKDLQGIGAMIENICLQATYMGLGTCWIGEILNSEEMVNRLLEVPDNYELMAVICVGYEKKEGIHSERLAADELIYKYI